MASRFLVIGAGFSGAVLARELAGKTGCTIDVWEERNKIGGNCHTSRDQETGVMIHRYGPHIFNTDKKEIWDYVNSFAPFMPYVHRVKAMHNGKVYPLPLNLYTLNQFFNKVIVKVIYLLDDIINISALQFCFVAISANLDLCVFLIC